MPVIIGGSGTANGITSFSSGATFLSTLGVTGAITGYSVISGAVSVTGTTTLTSSAFGKLHQCSGTSANYAVTLPAVSGNAGRVIAFQMSTALTKLVTITGSGAETIDGSNTRIMWAGESAVLYCDGTAWTKIGGKTIPMVAGQTTSTTQSVATGTATKKTLGTAYASNCPTAMNDTTNSRVTIQRASVYNVISSSRISSITTNTTQEAFIYIDSSEQGLVSRYSTTGDYSAVQISMNYTLNANQNIENYVRQYSGVNQTYLNNNVNNLFVTEIPQW